MHRFQNQMLEQPIARQDVLSAETDIRSALLRFEFDFRSDCLGDVGLARLGSVRVDAAHAVHAEAVPLHHGAHPARHVFEAPPAVDVYDRHAERVGVHPAAQFRVTLKWSDSKNKDNLRPAPEAVLPLLHLFVDDEEVTDQYLDGAVVTDNGNNTYTIRFKNLLPADYTMRIDVPSGYTGSKKPVHDGATVTLTHFVKISITPVKPVPVTPIRPPRG